jgi:glycosyltransferase involved in cell wall biosynthesis
MGLGPGPLVAFSGRLAGQKNPALFIEAAARIARAHPGARFVVIGDGPERPRLEEAAGAAGLAPRLKFLGPREDARDLYPGADVMVFTSRYEGLPFTVLEAMAAGIPVVAPRIPGMDEAVVDGGTGRLLESSGAEDYAAAVLALLSDAPARARMGHAARVRVLERFSARGMAARTAAAYADLVQRGPGSRPASRR